MLVEHRTQVNVEVLCHDRPGLAGRVHELLEDQHWLSAVVEESLEVQIGECEVHVRVLDRG